MQFACLIFVSNIFFMDRLKCINATELPELIYDLCPFSDICNRTASRIQNSTKGRIPCCTSCGCDEDCGLRLDCCFDHLDKYRLEEKRMVACINPEIRHEKTQNKIMYVIGKHYLIVQACGINHLKRKKADIAIKYCRLKDENGSSLIAPVSSQGTDLIFVNEECAVCNGINIASIKHWNYLIQSSNVPKESTVVEIQNKLWSNFGRKTFIPPAGENWSHMYCSSNSENCLVNSEWYYLCQNVRAKFHQILFSREYLYKNAFCLLCTGLPVNSVDKECKIESLKVLRLAPMTILINSVVIEDSKLYARISVTDIPKTAFSCPKRHVETLEKICLPINCPEGMLWTQNGCKYFALGWYAERLMMQIKLIPINKTRISADNLNGIGERMNPLLWLNIPCRKIGLSYVEVHYSTENDGCEQTVQEDEITDYITSFIVRISKSPERETSVDPSVIIPIFQKCVNEHWIAKFENETYIFHAYFDKYFGYVQDGQQKLKTWPGEEIEDIARPAFYTRVGEPFPIEGMALKKPFFCNYVSVPMYDVSFRSGEILIISKNLSLGTNEYIVHTNGVNGDINAESWKKTTFSVCIDDYDPSYTETSGSIKYRHSPLETFIIVFFVCFLL